MRARTLVILLFAFGMFVWGAPAHATALDSEIGEITGMAKGEGSHFQIIDSDYLNISLDSAEIIKLRMESMPEIITMRIESVSVYATSTLITMTGLVPDTMYYKYEDSYHNFTQIFSDGNGSYAYTQDISTPHRVFIQPKKSTKFIRNDATGGDCASMGIWNSLTLTCTLTTDLAETVQIDSDGVTLDGGGHTTNGSRTGSGVYLYAKSDVAVKNLIIKNFSFGITTNESSRNILDSNTFFNNVQAIVLYGSSNNLLHSNVISIDVISQSRYQSVVLFDSNNNLLDGNSISMNKNMNPGRHHQGIIFFDSYNNTIINNILFNINEAFLLFDSDANKIYHNDLINNGTHVITYGGTTNVFNLPMPNGGNYWDTFDDSTEGCSDTNGDGICDTPYIFTSGRYTLPVNDTLPWTKQDGWKNSPDPCAAPGACASSVLFLPGIEASRLYRLDYASGTSKLWEPSGDADARDLFMDESGESVRHDVYAKGVVDEAYGTLNIYKSFLADLGEWKSSGVINDYRAAPYDWRVSLDDLLDYGREMPDGRLYYSGDLHATSTPYIVQELRRLVAGSKTGKVTIVAHSNGGLVAKALLKRLQEAHNPLLDKIDSLVMVAVPQAGTPQAVGALLHGYEQGLPRDWLSVFLTPATARALAANLPSAYNLLPSADYFTYVDDPVVEFDDSDFLAEFRARYDSKIHDGAQLRNFITDARRLASSSPSDLLYPSVGNVALLSRAEAFHAAADAWAPPPGLALHEVAGWGEDTLATIRYYEGKKTVCANPSASTCQYYTTAPTLLYEPIEVVDGDGTVLVPSALWTSASTTRKYWVNLRDYGASGPLNSAVNRKHADILEVPDIRTLIRNILTNATSTPYTFITTTQPVASISDERLRFVLHSPLELSATDILGNVVSSATSTIPGARWKRYGEVQTLTVPRHTPLTLALDGIAAGSFTLDMQEIDGRNAIVTSSTLSAVPSATSTRATMVLADGTVEHASPLRVDYDGDGDTDFSLRPEIGQTTVFDTTPPEALIALDPLSQRLEIIGFDNLSSTTVSTTATSSTITDEAGNTLEIVFKKFRREKRELKLEILELRYNGVSAGTAARNALQYEWSADRAGKVRELEQEARAGSSKIEAHYSAKKNTTRIEDEKNGGREIVKNLSGLIIIGLKTKKGSIIIDY